MGADNWVKCPFCSQSEIERIEKLEKILVYNYNKISAYYYDRLKYNINKKIEQISKQMEETTYCRIDGVNEYGFDSQGNFTIDIQASCPHCKRYWRINTKQEPKIRSGLT